MKELSRSCRLFFLERLDFGDDFFTDFKYGFAIGIDDDIRRILISSSTGVH